MTTCLSPNKLLCYQQLSIEFDRRSKVVCYIMSAHNSKSFVCKHHVKTLSSFGNGASEMTYIVSSGALNSTPTNNQADWNLSNISFSC